MSNPRYWWDYTIKKILRRYPDKLAEDGSIQSAIAMKAIEDTIRETLLVQDGEDRVKLIKMLYMDQTHTFVGASMALNISTATAYRWMQKFVYDVGRRMGYMKYK